MGKSRQSRMLGHEHDVATDAESVALFESALRALHDKHMVAGSAEERVAWLAACDEARKSRRNRVKGDPVTVVVAGRRVIPVAPASMTDEEGNHHMATATVEDLRSHGLWPFPSPK